MAKKPELNEAQEYFINNNLHKSAEVLANATNLPELLVEKYLKWIKDEEFKTKKAKPEKKEEKEGLPAKPKNNLAKHKRGGAVSMTLQASYEADEAYKNQERKVPPHNGYANKFFEDTA